MQRFWQRGRGLLLAGHVDASLQVEDMVTSPVHAMPWNASIGDALSVCLSGHRNIPLTDRSGKVFVGFATSRGILGFLEAGTGKARHPLKAQARRIMEKGHISLPRSAILRDAFIVMRRSGQEAVPLTEGSMLSGMITEHDVVSLVRGKTGVRVWEVMTPRPAAIQNRLPVSEVSGMLARGGFRRLPVVRERYLAGIVTPADILIYLRESGRLDSLSRDRTEVDKAMNKAVVSVSPHADIGEAAGLMRSRKVSMLPVVDGYRLVGVLTQRDIIEAM